MRDLSLLLRRPLLAATLMALLFGSGCASCDNSTGDTSRDAGEDAALDMPNEADQSSDMVGEEDALMHPDAAADMPGGEDLGTPGEFTARFVVDGKEWLHEPLVLDASGTLDPEGGSITYSWDLGEGDPLLSDGPRIGHAFHTLGERTITLTARTEDGRASMATRTVTISEPVAQGTATLTGYVTGDDGFALPGVEVRRSDTGERLGETDIAGRYEVVIRRGMPVLLTFERSGWNKQLQRLDVTASLDRAARDVSLTRAGERLIFADATDALEVELLDGTQLEFPERAFVYASDGEPVQGQLLIEVTPIRPQGGRVPGFPGSFEALRQGRAPSLIATHGTVEVKLSQGDERVELADGVEVDLAIPLGTSAPVGDTIDLWSLDERNGFWTWEGTGTVEQNPRDSSARVLRATVSHFSVWNADEPVRSSPGDVGLALPPGLSPDDLVVHTTATSPDGAVISGGRSGSVQPGDGSAPPTVGIDVVENYDSLVEVSSKESCLYGALALAPGEDISDAVLEVFKTNEGSVKLTPGMPEEIALDNARDFEIAYFDERQDTYWSLSVEAADNQTSGTISILSGCSGSPTATLEFGPASSSSLVIAPGEDATRAILIEADNLDASVRLMIEPLIAPATLEDDTLGHAQQVDWTTNSTEERWLYLNRGQVAHIALTGELPPLAKLSMVTPNARTREPLRAPFTPQSYRYDAQESGWHLFVLNPIEAPPEPRTYTVHLGEVRAPIPITYNNRSARSSVSERVFELAPGDVQRFLANKPEDALLYISPRLVEGSMSNFAPRLSGQITLERAPQSDLPSYKTLTSTSEFDPEFSLYSPALDAISYRLETDMIARDQAAVLVGTQASCEGDTPTTPYAMLGARALARGGTLTLCEGTHEVFDGLDFDKEAARIVGAQMDRARYPVLRSWRGDVPIATDDHVLALERLELVLQEEGQRLRLRDLEDGAMTLRHLILSGDVVGAQPALDIEGPSNADWAQTLERVQIEDLEFTANAQEALRLEHLFEATIWDIAITSTKDRGVYLRDVSSSLLEGVTIDDALQPIEWQGSYDMTLSHIDIVHSTPPAQTFGKTPSILVRDAAPSLSPSTQTSSSVLLEDVSVRLGFGSQIGVQLIGEGQSNPTAFRIERLFVDAAGMSDTVAVRVEQRRGGGTLELMSSVLKGFTEHGLEVLRADRFDRVSILHATLQIAGAMTTARRDLIELEGAIAGTFVDIMNSIFSAEQEDTNTAAVDLHDATASEDGVVSEVTHNLFYNIGARFARESSAASLGGAFDVTADPQFIDAELRLSPQSPAIDQGKLTSTVTLDRDGDPRVQGAQSDIGAYEH